jgi:hypothetical protein
MLIQPRLLQQSYVIKKPEFYAEVLKKHAISKERFQSSLNFYSNNPENFDKIYEKVIEELTIMQGNLMGADSLRVNSEE